MTKETDTPIKSKVDRLISEYELEGLGEELEMRWTGSGYDRTSLRDLADLFNEQLLEQVLYNTDVVTVDRDVESLYKNLTGEDVSAGVQTETYNYLERNGVDVDALEADFVTYQAIRTYLKEQRGAELERISDKEKVEKDRDSIQRLLSRTNSVIEDRIENLRKTERLDLEEYEVFIDSHILCQICGTRYTVDELLSQGGCECQQ